MPRSIPQPILEDFAAGVLELRAGETGPEVWRVKRRIGERLIPARPARRIDRPNLYGGARVTVRRGAQVFRTSLASIVAANVEQYST